MTTAPVPAIGSAAPDFTLDATSGSKVSLAEFRGRRDVLLAFFPLAFTSTCTAELCAISDDYGTFTRLGVEVIPISVDSVATLKEYRAKYHLGVELASDFRRDVSRAYGTLNEERFYSNRAYFLIDREGRVRWRHVETANRDKRDNAELFAEIEKLGRRETADRRR
ncbi:MAG: redoxin domain-containing protein [Gemmatimonadota bacterium]|nr:redoxin domain-containing protein [Gemmatimonadota bacterium]